MMPELRQVTVGTRLPPLSKVISDSSTELVYQRTLLLAEKLDRSFKKYARGPNIHTDDAAAQAAGLPGRVAPGIQCFSFISEMLSRLFGMNWICGGKIKIKFIRPILIGETIICEGEVKQIFPSEKKGEGFAELEVWCKNAQGDIVTSGSATVGIF
jgi:acyl dehydratase